MEDKEILKLWQTQNEKIEQSLTINRKLLVETIKYKAKNSLRSLEILKTSGIIAFILYLLVLTYILLYTFSNYSRISNYFLISISAIFIINMRGLYDYIKHLTWSKNIDFDGSIMEIQQKLSKLQLSIVNHSKVMVLQLPFWTTIYLDNSWFPSSVGGYYIIFQILFTGTFTLIAIWLYKNQKIENLNKTWYKKLLAGSGGSSVEKALQFYKELESFKSEK